MLFTILNFIATYYITIFSFKIVVFESISLATGIIFFIFAIVTNKIAWIFGFISSLIVIILCVNSATYFQALLHLYYTIIAVYAYVLWSKTDLNNIKSVKVTEYTLKTHLILICTTLFIVAIVYIFFNKIFHIPAKQLDVLIFILSIIATYLQVRKILSNWIYWIIINMLTLILGIQLNLYSVAILMLGYTLFAAIGYVRWKKIRFMQK